MENMTEGLEIRPAGLEDSSIAARLIALSMGDLGVALFGLGRMETQLNALSKMYAGLDTWISHRWCEMACVDNEPAGLLLSFPGKEIDHLNAEVFLHLWGIYGVGGTIRFISRIIRYMGYKECEPHQYYISNLAVLPEMQGKGVGAALLKRAEQKGRAAGFKVTSLVVELDNVRAKALYERVGYRELETVHTPHLRSLLGTAGFIRMEKPIV